MKNSVLNLQDLFLNNARKERIPVTIYLMNGVQVKGHVKGFDSYIILLEGDNKQQNMIYKHAVSTILPNKYISFQNQNQQGNNNR
ncbi:RNA chaperone Hfq [Romboutsia maritimum]|uniref:RNA-binding protein Hfq n=1 Tax=Romboutsia maritimum TaxID=2020948 RepID=A0A371IUV0_9FIRM|nr:RNA chaperone Hfq [Romboutsia maritimum]RDY24260.1 RNA chaperone Hfq [Romboutsia maritimum]